jgi:hypothetical protein
MTRFMALGAAVEDHVRDGALVALEGFTHLIPHAAGHEIIRQGRRDLTLALHPGVAVDDVRARTGWELKVADDLREIEPPSPQELAVLRDLQATRGLSG